MVGTLSGQREWVHWEFFKYNQYSYPCNIVLAYLYEYSYHINCLFLKRLSKDDKINMLAYWTRLTKSHLNMWSSQLNSHSSHNSHNW